MPDGRFPTEEWLRKRGKHANRRGEAYNTFCIYIHRWLGGVRQLRELLEQAHFSTNEWDKEKAMAAYEDFCERYGITPAQAIARFIRKGEGTRESYREAARVAAAVRKYAGGAPRRGVLIRPITFDPENL